MPARPQELLPKNSSAGEPPISPAERADRAEIVAAHRHLGQLEPLALRIIEHCHARTAPRAGKHVNGAQALALDRLVRWPCARTLTLWPWPRARPCRPSRSRPAPTTRTLTPAGIRAVGYPGRRGCRPAPVGHVGRVLAVFACVGAVAQALVHHLLAECAARSDSPGTRSITSITRWKRSRSLSITMSNGVVVVPSSL